MAGVGQGHRGDVWAAGQQGAWVLAGVGQIAFVVLVSTNVGTLMSFTLARFVWTAVW